GWYLPEAAHPCYVLSPYFDIDFAVPKAPNPPVDPSSTEVSAEIMYNVRAFLEHRLPKP
ncbi:hypothetical protein F5J12DRAFT_710189, partial [Pisolithus orientalis]|uniref:uncharacterized protein n=1 Tax=Pisolithus orientalis TaxID=936130 RepID=UPI0022241D10